MVKTLTSVGNSKAVILPAELIKKHKLDKVLIEDTEEGILIRPASTITSFHKEVEKLRKNKTALYKRMEKQANTPDTIRYYASAANLSDVDPEIIEE